MFTVLSNTHFDLKILIPIALLLFIAAIIPVILSLFKIKIIPVLVIEILVGIFLGSFKTKELFANFDNLNPLMEGLYIIGMGVLLFLSGLDTDFSVFKKISKKDKTVHVNALTNILLLTVIILSVVASLFFIKYMNNKILGVLLLTVIFSSTFASIVIPLTHNEELHNSTIGKIISTYATKSEFLSILVLSIVMLLEGFVIEHQKPLLLILMIIILILIYVFNRYFKIDRFKKISGGIVHFSVRLIVAVLLGLMILCSVSGVEYILGAFLAGSVIKSAKPTKETIHKLEIIGYGIFVPMFYILVGVKIGIHMSMLEIIKWENLSLILLLFIILIIVKIPFGYLLKWFKISTVIQTTIFVSCTLITSITVHEFGVFEEKFIDALIVASCLTCIISPILFDITKKYGYSKIKNDTRVINPN